MKATLTIGLLLMGWACALPASPATQPPVRLAEAGVEAADPQQHLRLNFISKRPYKSQAYKSQSEDDKWEGATLVVEEDEAAAPVAPPGKVKSNINQFSKRPYLKRNVD